VVDAKVGRTVDVRPRCEVSRRLSIRALLKRSLREGLRVARRLATDPSKGTSIASGRVHSVPQGSGRVGAMTCPDCGSQQLRCIGILPDVGFFAGSRLDEPLPGGELIQCKRCDLRFRHPHLGIATYDKLYDNARTDTWIAGPLRVDQRLVQSLAQGARFGSPGARVRVLDFGCYAGDLLCSLPAQFEKFGIEVNATAGALAAKRAGARVERDLDHLPPELRFELIVAMDVIEHVPSPRALLKRLVERLAPGGRLVITTGDGAHWLWRLLGGRWWYCHFPEHIAFISRRWLRHHAGGLGVSVQQASSFNYLDAAERPPFLRGWKALLRYVLRPGEHAQRQQHHAARHGSDLGVPGIGLTRDHLLLVVGA
jgi:SAM-dependent methyltransferase